MCSAYVSAAIGDTYKVVSESIAALRMMSSMADAPNYSFHRNPRFSANHLSEYLTTANANQREAVIRKAKFPRKVSVVAYSQALPAIGKFLSSNSGDLSYFDDALSRLAAKELREDGYNRDEAKRCQAAIEAFKATFSTGSARKYRFGPGPQDLSFKISDVRVSVRLDAPISEEGNDGQLFSGGCVLLMASTPDARKNIEDRRKYVAALVHWALQEGSSQIEPLPCLCMSFDPFGGEITKAPTATERLRRTMASSCREVAACWDNIQPPAGYDGPAWS